MSPMRVPRNRIVDSRVSEEGRRQGKSAGPPLRGSIGPWFYSISLRHKAHSLLYPFSDPERGAPAMAVMLRATSVGCAVTLLAAACRSDRAKAAPSVVDVVVAPVQVRDVPIVQEWAAQTFGANDVEVRARLRPLAERNAVSRQDLDHAVAAQQAAQGQVDAAQAALRTAQLDLGYTKVTSPIRSEERRV